jgi:serine protease AprX
MSAMKPLATTEPAVCPLCAAPSTQALLAETAWQPEDVLRRLGEKHPEWRRADGACPACVQQALLITLLERGEASLHEGVQRVWPLDAESVFGALPTPLRMHADPRFAGRGVAMAFVDAGFYPHADLVTPRNRIRAWADASGVRVRARRFATSEIPVWPGWDRRAAWQWHGMMTSSSAAGNGAMSHGLYRGMACEADVILVQVRDAQGHISSAAITRALCWLRRNAARFGLRVVSLSVSGDPEDAVPGNAVDSEVRRLVEQGVVVIAAAGNDGVRRLLPPATAPEALTIGGLDDKNTLRHEEHMVWHSNFGEAAGAAELKPELVAPSIWVVAPVMPGTPVAQEAEELFARRAANRANGSGHAQEDLERLRGLKLVTPHYQHVEGTSFAAPIVSSVVACMLEANPALSPRAVREILLAAARPVPGAPAERQGAGALDAGLAVALALEWRAGGFEQHPESPQVSAKVVAFHLHDREAECVEVLGSWNGWRAPGALARRTQPGVWRAECAPPPAGRYEYKFLLDGRRWLSDPLNPRRAHDGQGGFNSVLQI